MDFIVEPLAEDALLLRFGEGIDPAVNARVQAAARALQGAALPGVSDIAPAYASLFLRFDPFAWNDTEGAPQARLLDALQNALADDDRELRDVGARTARIVEIPVCYDGEYAPDLDAVAAHSRLTAAEVVTRHAAREYSVAMLGFAPGFPYLLGLDPALHMPRRATPRMRVPAGSVAIGGAQTGIYPRELPGGWQIIGRTPLVLFDPARDPPCLLAPGDRVCFRVIDAGEFVGLVEKRGQGWPPCDSRDQG